MSLFSNKVHVMKCSICSHKQQQLLLITIYMHTIQNKATIRQHLCTATNIRYTNDNKVCKLAQSTIIRNTITHWRHHAEMCATQTSGPPGRPQPNCSRPLPSTSAPFRLCIQSDYTGASSGSAAPKLPLANARWPHQHTQISLATCRSAHQQ